VDFALVGGARVLYSTWRWTLIAIFLLFAGAVSFAASLTSVEAGIVAALAFGFVGLVILPFHFALLGDRLRESDGVFPHPSWDWPRIGFRIVDDRPPRSEVSASTAEESRPVCPNCRAVAANASEKYCHECGTPFAPASDSSPTW